VDCKCHGEPAYWNADKRKKPGGYWLCAVKKRRYEMARYDADPIHRIEKNLANRRRERGRTLQLRKEALHGSPPSEGLD
jgi:hypothetical protein